MKPFASEATSNDPDVMSPADRGQKSDSHARNEAIDAFRGIAIISVLLFHYLVRWAPPWNATNIYGYRATYPAVLGLGGLGVHLFFVISGLVITMTVLRSRNAIEFAAKRFARLYPAYLFGLIVTLIVTTLSTIPAFRVGLWDALANLTMLPSDLHRKPVDGAYWSLAVEIKFYLLVAAAYLFLQRQFWIGILAAAAVGLALFEGGHSESLLLVTYAPFFLFGMAIWFWMFERMTMPALVLTSAALLLYGAFHRAYEIPHVAAYLPHLYIFISVAAFVAFLASGDHFSFGPLSAIGRVSYSLYLIHQYVGVILIANFVAMGFGDGLACACTCAICLGIAALMFRYVEQPGQQFVMRLYRQIAPTERPRVPNGTGAHDPMVYGTLTSGFESRLTRPQTGER
ncbi:MAG TPA: acyltransferase [Rhizomicrobium sp.]